MSVPALLAVLALLFGQAGELAQPADPRIQVVTYNPDQVVTLSVTPGYAAVVELGADERVDSVVVGDSAGWQVTASKRGDSVVVKPIAAAPSTDMVVITGDRRYVFLLQSAGDGQAAPFVMRFVYPEVVAAVLAIAPVPVASFRFRGAKALFPATMTDDGKRTTISWGRDMPLPAIFAMGKDGREAIINGRMVGGDYVVERVAERFVFRRGEDEATARRRRVAVR